jgi:hypothetical protein
MLKASEAIQMVRQLAGEVGGVFELMDIASALSDSLLPRSDDENAEVQPTVKAADPIAESPSKRRGQGRKPKGDRRPRATPEDIASRKSAVMGAAKKLDEWFAKGDIEAKLGEEVDTRTLALLVEEKVLEKKGEKRNTRYRVKA